MLAEILCLSLALGGDVLANPGFEEPASDDDRPPGWTFALGAQNGATTPESEVRLDREERHGGKASLRFRGVEATRGWILAKQAIEVRPGGTYSLEAWTRTAGVEPNGFGLNNAYLGIFFFDAEGALVGRALAHPERPDSPWSRREVSLKADERARTGYVSVFLSMLGTLWVDDLALTVTGGTPIPPPKILWSEDFARAKRLDSGWKHSVGATNGTGGKDSVAEIDSEVGAPESPGSLHLAGELATLRWTHLARELPAEPGDFFRWSGEVSSREVRAEGRQFSNLHMNLAFLDAKGNALGTPVFASLGPGTQDWTALEARAVAPEGTRKVRAGLFLSMSGDAWFDRLELSVEKGYPVPYGDWITLESKGIVLRYPPSHPHAGEMKAHLAALEQSRRTTCRALDLELPEKITVLLYLDNEQGRRLTGRDLDFADPGNRRVHQRWESYIGHEMVHVIANGVLGEARTGLLGEGIAVWLNGQARSHHQHARELLEKGELPSVKDLLERFRELDAGYPAAGSFCGFFLEQFDLETFKKIYTSPDPSAALQELEGQRFEDLEGKWHERIRRG